MAAVYVGSARFQMNGKHRFACGFHCSLHAFSRAFRLPPAVFRRSAQALLCQLQQLFPVRDANASPGKGHRSFRLQVLEHSGHNLPGGAKVPRQLVMGDFEFLPTGELALFREKRRQTGIHPLVHHLVEQPHHIRKALGHQFVGEVGHRRGLLHHGAIWSGARGQGGLAEHLPFPDGTWGSEVTVPAILSYSGIQGGFSAFLSDYEKKGPAALKAAHRFFSLLSPILSSLFWLYDPALFVLYSPFTAACEPLFLALQQSLGPNKSRLYRSFFQQDAALFGALAFGVCQFLGIRTFASPHFPSPLTEERMEEQK